MRLIVIIVIILYVPIIIRLAQKRAPTAQVGPFSSSSSPSHTPEEGAHNMNPSWPDGLVIIIIINNNISHH
jgi:hypothetical protein